MNAGRCSIEMHFKFVALAIISACSCHAVKLEELVDWTFLDFENNTAADYVPENNICTGIQASRNKLFLSMPSCRPGQPVTLATILKPNEKLKNPLLQPFPSWDWQKGNSDGCKSLVSVFRTRLDPCGRLWVLDCGSINVMENAQNVCPPKLILFDAETGKELERAIIPKKLLGPNSLMVSLALDTKDEDILHTCDHTGSMIVYMSDNVGNIIVFDRKTRNFWKHTHHSFQPEEKHANISIHGEMINMPDGILGMAVGHYHGKKVLFYQPLASLNIYAIPTSWLLSRKKHNVHPFIVWRKSSQGAGLIVNKLDQVIFSPLSETKVVELDNSKHKAHLIAKDEEKLQFVSDMALDRHNDLWVLADQFHKYINRKFSPNNVNMRILKISDKYSGLIPVNRDGNTGGTLHYDCQEPPCTFKFLHFVQ